MNPPRWRAGRPAAAALSGLLLIPAFPPIDAGWVAFFALVPLLLALRGARARTGALLGLCAGLGFFAILLYWISYFGYVAWIVLVLGEAAFWAVFGAFVARASRLGVSVRVAGAGLLFGALELARSRYPFGGFAWGSLGSSQHAGGPTVHLAKLGGVTAVSIAIVAINALLAEAIADRRFARSIGALGVAGAIALVPAAIPIGLAGARSGTLDIAAVQGNVPRNRFTAIGRRGRVGPEDTVIVDNHIAVTQRLLGSPPPDLIVWPENSFDRDPRTNPQLVQPVVEVIARIGSPLLFGAILDYGTDRFTNTNLLIDTTGRIQGRYDKRHLVPFGEYVPMRFFRRVVPVLDRELPYDGLAGRSAVVFDVGGTRVGTVICFESTYPELARSEVRSGAQVLVVTTNNASFGTSPAAREHLAMSQMRAIEEGRAVVHDAIAGISAIIEPDGRIVQRTKLFQPALLRARLALTDAQTPYTRYGSLIELAFALGGALFAIAAFARRPADGGGE